LLAVLLLLDSTVVVVVWVIVEEVVVVLTTVVVVVPVGPTLVEMSVVVTKEVTVLVIERLPPIE